MARGVRFLFAALCLFGHMMTLVSCGSGQGDSGASAPAALLTAAPGGFIEKAGNAIRSRWSSQKLQTFVPQGRGKFTFPPPYNTQAVRLTTAADCGGSDCVTYVGYSYWRNMNNHVNSDRMLIFLSFDRASGGSGPTLLSYDKMTDQVSVLGPLFDKSHPLSWASAVGWYFSASLPTKLYLNDGSKMFRYDVATLELQEIFDVSDHYGPDRRLAQMHTSNDDRVHSATLQIASTGENLGCVVFVEADGTFRFFPKVGQFDECQIDKSGRYLMMLDQVDGRNGVDNRYIDLATGTEQRVLNIPDQGSVGHHDLGYGYVVGHDGYNPLPNATLTWQLSPFSRGPVEHRDYNWDLVQANHISHANAQPGVPKEQQYACGSNADRMTYAQNEILCFPLDGSLRQLVVAPVMTNLDASGGGGDYQKMPKGNVDVTGRYFIWTTNLGGSRLDAFVVKVPGHLLTGA